ncbi:MAG TPA: MFS transporter [Stellaceae bacterium]|nr:MFS transporter [Stellaceae bacterium]
MSGTTQDGIIETDIPARLDRLPWSGFHTLVITALGITWILDGLEVTLAGAVSGALMASPALRMTPADIGLSASLYLAGAVTGALGFGYLTDRLGRKKLFSVTLGVYLVATALSALAPDMAWFCVFRFFTGAGIGGEYTAINSAIQELIPAHYRGRTDLLVNGSFWLGAALGAVGAVILLRPGLLPPDIGWRCAFGIGAVLGLLILLLRRFLPESPRWLMTHGDMRAAERIAGEIECRVQAACPDRPLPPPLGTLRLHADATRSLGRVMVSLFRDHRDRAWVSLALMTAQAFFYNAIFFTYALVLGRFYDVPAEGIGWYILPFSAGNFLGPLLLGPLFDIVGRRMMIALTYLLSGVALTVTALLFSHGMLDVTGQTVAWAVTFFFASAAASSAYLTVAESFPLETRALAIAMFYAIGTAVGGGIGPWLFGTLIGSGDRGPITLGYLFGALLMIGAAAVAWWFGIDAERRPLEDIAAPLSAARDRV